MKGSISEKILTLDEIVDKVKALKHEGKVVVQSHGVFDLIHPGIIKHLKLFKTRMCIEALEGQFSRRYSGQRMWHPLSKLTMCVS